MSAPAPAAPAAPRAEAVLDIEGMKQRVLSWRDHA
mgnify:CR=1 FL=1